ncbi:hypothetical protein [Kordia sp.]|uniref:hypothetical protein n=1 Tax=Kordia sp. TaxID=1965332 RepID=UPI003B5AF96D
MKKINHLFIVMFVSVLCGCSTKTPSSLPINDIKTTDNSTIINMSTSIDFNNEDELIIVDSLFLSKMASLVKNNSKKSQIVYLATHGDRSYLNNLQYRANKVREYFISKGVETSTLTAELGFDYQTKYPKLKNSNLILHLQ